MNNRILVIGGAGIIGSHLCVRLFGIANFEMLRQDVNFPLYVEVDQIYNLDWEPAVSLEDCLKQTIGYIRKLLNA